MRLACDKLKVDAELFCNESADIVDEKAFAQRRVKRCQATDGHDRFGTCTPQRANQCARKRDSDLKILECGIGITAIRFRARLIITLNARALDCEVIDAESSTADAQVAKKAAVVPTMSKMRLIMPRCCLVRVTADEDFVSGILRLSAAFWHRSALRIVTKW